MKEQNHLTTKYYHSGKNPHLAILAGTHGNEYEIIQVITALLDKYMDLFPDFIYIPEVSPTAVKAKTRENKWGRDVNRCFKSGTTDPEALATMNIIEGYNINYCVSFHEDPDLAEELYIYDSQKMVVERLENFREAMENAEVELFSGIDDPELKLEITGGYWHLDKAPNESAGNLLEWAVANGAINRIMEVEIPGKASKEHKQKLAKLLFKHLILPLANYQSTSQQAAYHGSLDNRLFY